MSARDSGQRVPEAPDHLVVGHVARAHGVRGELLIHLLTDRPEEVFSEGRTLLPADPRGAAPDPALPRLTVEASRPYRKGFLVRFRNLDDRTTAEEFRGRYLLLATVDVPERAEGELFYHELLGMEVVTTEGEVVGTVREVFEMEPADLLEVRGGGRLRYVPFRKEVVSEVRPDERRLVIDPPEGLLDL